MVLLVRFSSDWNPKSPGPTTAPTPKGPRPESLPQSPPPLPPKEPRTLPAGPLPGPFEAVGLLGPADSCVFCFLEGTSTGIAVDATISDSTDTVIPLTYSESLEGDICFSTVLAPQPHVLVRFML